MIEAEKKKVTVRRSRRASGAGTVTVKRRRVAETPHVVDLKHPVYSEPKTTIAVPDHVEFTGSGISSSWPFGAYKKIALTFIILAIGVLGLVAYFAAVRLDITVVPKVKAVTGQASFMIYDRPQDYTIPTGGILGMVREMEVQYTGNFPASGTEVLGAEVAGTVTIVNNYTKDQPLVATTRLLTSSNQLLRLKDSVVVPAGGSVQADVYGDSVDPSFTLADTKLTIPGLWAGLQDKIYAEAQAGAVTYKEKNKITVTQADLDKAIEAAKQALVEKAATDIESAYASYDERLYQIDDGSTAFSFDSKVGDEKKEFSITMSSKLAVVAFKKDALSGLNQTALDSVLDQGEKLVDDSANAPSFKILSADTKDNVAQAELTVGGAATPDLSKDIIDRSKLVGLTREQLESYLSGLDTIESYQLYFHPSFFEIAPQLVDRITITTK